MDDRLTIGPLASSAGVTPRTVRYYVSLGLIPPPAGRGRAGLYGPEHLSRLRLVRLLKERGLSLSEIDERTRGLSKEEVERLVRRIKRKESRRKEPEDDLEYIIHKVALHDDLPSPLRSPKGKVPKGTFERLFPDSRMEPVEDEATWKRATIAPGVEVHFTSDLGTSEYEIRAAIEAARRELTKRREK